MTAHIPTPEEIRTFWEDGYDVDLTRVHRRPCPCPSNEELLDPLLDPDLVHDAVLVEDES